MKRKFVRALPFFAVVLGLVLAGCTLESEDNGGSGGTKLVEGEWTDGKISEEGQTKKYTVEVSKGTRYFIYMNNAWNGDSTKTGYTGIKISHSDGTVICNSYYNIRECWEEPVTFVAQSNGTVTLTIASCSASGWVTAAIDSNWEKGTGTYAIKYISRPEYITLTNADNGDWYSDKIIAEGQTNRYRFEVISGIKYSIAMNNAWDGDSTKTGYTGIKIYHSDGTVICNSYYNIRECWEEPFTFTAQSNGTITLIVASCSASGWATAAIDSNWEKGTGTYAIKYGIDNSTNDSDQDDFSE